MRSVLVAFVVLAAVLATTDPVLGAARKVNLEEQVLYENYFRFSGAWNRGDPDGLVELYDEETDHFSADGRVAKGRTEVRELFADQLDTVYEGSRLTLTLDSLRFLSPEIALANGQFELVNVKGPSGRPLPPLRGLHTDIWVLSDGTWRVAASRTALPARMPTTRTARAETAAPDAQTAQAPVKTGPQ
ncbi:MAG: nuclear transport factor 2 family protein [Deltaproteobacteria bacterium]|nr:nuclear transport factor 2 family protein [Deltaproteobacteria bacterium]